MSDGHRRQGVRLGPRSTDHRWHLRLFILHGSTFPSLSLSPFVPPFRVLLPLSHDTKHTLPIFIEPTTPRQRLCRPWQPSTPPCRWEDATAACMSPIGPVHAIKRTAPFLGFAGSPPHPSYLPSSPLLCLRPPLSSSTPGLLSVLAAKGRLLS